jgi:hypothetical protein
MKVEDWNPPNPFDITVPPLADASTVFKGTAESDFDIFAGMPHMHEVGRSFRHELHRKNGGNEMIIELEDSTRCTIDDGCAKLCQNEIGYVVTNHRNRAEWRNFPRLACWLLRAAWSARDLS